MLNVFEKVYCAFCKLERGVCRKKHINWTNVVLSAFCSLLIMYVVWGDVEPKTVIIFAIAVMISEVFVHLRWRLTLACPHCHFDPALYQRNRAQASENVKTRLDALRKSGGHLLKTNNPFQHLPRITREELEKGNKSKKGLPSVNAKPEPILSRHV